MRTVTRWQHTLLMSIGLLLVLSPGVQAQTGVIDPPLQITLRCMAPEKTLAVIVRFTAGTDVRDPQWQQVFEALGARDIAVLWIIHSIAATVPAGAIPAIAALPGVEHIRLDEPIALPPPLQPPQPAHFAPPCMVEPGGCGLQPPLLEDVNGIGSNDVLLPSRSAGEAHIGVHCNAGERPWQDTASFAVSRFMHDVQLGDFNADGTIELVINARGTLHDTTIWHNLCGENLRAPEMLLIFSEHGSGTCQPAVCFVLDASATLHRVHISGMVVADFYADCYDDSAAMDDLHVDDLHNDGHTDLCVVFANATQATTTVPAQPVSTNNPPTGNPPAPEIPSVPTGLTATDITQTTLTLAWSASAGDVDAVEYRLYEYAWLNRFVSRWVLKRAGITTLSATVTNLSPGSPYTYAVTAVDAAGNESARSAAVEFRTLQAPTAYHPRHISQKEVFAVVGTPFAYNVDAIGHPAPQFSLVAGPAGMSVEVESGIVRWTPTAGDQAVVTVTVRATNSQGSDDHTFSVHVYPESTDLVPPSVVWTPVVTNATPTGGTLTWQAANDNVGVAGYLILAQRSGRGESLFIVADTATTETTHTLTTLQPATGYRLWVAAYDAAGNRTSISGVPPALLSTLVAGNR